MKNWNSRCLLFWIVKCCLSLPSQYLYDFSLVRPASFLQENGLTFSFEAVKRLQELVQGSGLTGPTSPRLRASAGSPCADPLLPQEFVPVCRQRGASASLTRLGEPVFRIQLIRDRQEVLVLSAHLIRGLVFVFSSNGAFGSLRDLCLCRLHWLLGLASSTTCGPQNRRFSGSIPNVSPAKWSHLSHLFANCYFVAY